MSVEDFMQSPLVRWIQLFRKELLTYADICDGTVVADIMKQMDLTTDILDFNFSVVDFKGRLQNWDIIVNAIQSYYQNILQQIIIMKLPDIATVCKDPYSDAAFEELQKVLLLILGCAVQCEHRQTCIEKIKTLSLPDQEKIMHSIKKVKDCPENILSLESVGENLDGVLSNSLYYSCILQLHCERQYNRSRFHEITAMLEELQIDNQRMEQASPNLDLTLQTTLLDKSNNSPNISHQFRRLQVELDEKTAENLDLHEQLRKMNWSAEKLHNENLELLKEASTARTCRDELDVALEKASLAKKYELENSKLRERMNELEFLRARVKELRCENKLLLETKFQMEEQNLLNEKRIRSLVDLEEQLDQYKRHLESISFERESDREKMRKLAEENTRLSFDRRTSHSLNVTLEEELEKAKFESDHSVSLAEQLSEKTTSKLLQLEAENQQLREQVTKIQCISTASADMENIQELEKENDHLRTVVEVLKECIREPRIAKELKHHSLEIGDDDDKNESEKMTISKKSFYNKSEIQKLDKEQNIAEHMVANDNLQILENGIWKSCEESNAIQSNVAENQEFGYSGNAPNLSSLQLIETLEGEKQVLENENAELKKSVHGLQLVFEKYGQSERIAEKLRLETEMLTKKLVGTEALMSRLTAAEQQNSQLKIDIECYQLTAESLKSSSSKIIDLQHEKDLLCCQIEQFKDSLEVAKQDRLAISRLERDLALAIGEKLQLKRHLESALNDLKLLQENCSHFELKNEELQKSVESHEIASRKYDHIQRENDVLEAENKDLLMVNSGLVKEVANLQKMAEDRRGTVEKLSTTTAELEAANKDLVRKLHRAQLFKSRIDEDPETEKKECEVFSHPIKNVHSSAVPVQVVAPNRAGTSSASSFLDTNSDMANVDTVDHLGIQSSSNRAEQMHWSDVLAEDNSVGSKLIKLERKNAILEEENQNLKSLRLELQQKIANIETHNLQIDKELSAAHGQCTVLQNQLERLHTDSTITEPKIALLESQNAMLQQEGATLKSRLLKVLDDERELSRLNVRLKKELSSVDRQHKIISAELSELQDEHEKLISDFNELVDENTKLRDDYEDLMNRYSKLEDELSKLQNECLVLKNEHSSLTVSFESQIEQKAQKLEEKYFRLVKELDELQSWKTEKETLESNIIYKLEAERANSNNSNEKKVIEKLQGDNDRMKEELAGKSSRLEEMDLRVSDLQGQLNESERINSGLAAKSEMFLLVQNRLEAENRSLMIQLQSFMSQNQDLLTQILNSKDHYAEEQKSYLNQLANLRRQKEKLEEKIFEQYKQQDSKKRSKGFSAFVRRAFSKDNKNKGKNKSFEESSPSPLEDSPLSAIKSSTLPCERTGIYGSSSDGFSSRARYDGKGKEKPGEKMRPVSSETKLPLDRDTSDDESITLKQFLKECDQSPMARKKLLQEKRIDLNHEDRPKTKDRNPNRLSLVSLFHPLTPREDTSTAKLFKSEFNLSETSWKSRTCDADDLTARNVYAENSLKSKTKRHDEFPLVNVRHKIDFVNDEISTISDNRICPMVKSEPQEHSFPARDVASAEPKQARCHIMLTEAEVILRQSIVDADNAPLIPQKSKSPFQPEKPVVISRGSDKGPSRGNRIECHSTSKPVDCIKTYKIKKDEVEMDSCSSSLVENISNKCAYETINSSVEEHGVLPSTPSTLSSGPKHKPIPFIDEMDQDEVSWRESNVCI